MRRSLIAAVTLLLATAVAPARATIDPRQVKAGWTQVASGLSGPVYAVSPPNDSRLFVVERPGRIRVIRNGVLKATPFLDVSRQVNTSGEGGLLSVAFKPDYATSGLFFVAFTDANMTLRIVRYHAMPSSDVAGPTGVSVLGIPHPGATNHDGGQLAFGPAGFLFIGTGDGGGGGDPNGNAQNKQSLLGKVLRIDVTHKASGKQYSIPPGNPYYGSTSARGEIWLVGLRNPWRFSFDRGHPDLWIGDVGQADREEVDKVSAGGLNLGWDCREGTLDTSSQYGGTYCTGSGYTAPVHEYTHDLGCAIVGGYVYRGTTYSSLVSGDYLFGDYCSGRIWLLGADSTGARVVSQAAQFSGHILGFGRDRSGELYLLSESGAVYHLTFAHR
jgi:glucose/arabinose dehydrogenase